MPPASALSHATWPHVQSSVAPQVEGRGVHAYVVGQQLALPPHFAAQSSVPAGHIPPSGPWMLPQPSVWYRTHTSPAPQVNRPQSKPLPGESVPVSTTWLSVPPSAASDPR